MCTYGACRSEPHMCSNESNAGLPETSCVVSVASRHLTLPRPGEGTSLFQLIVDLDEVAFAYIWGAGGWGGGWLAVESKWSR
jgi:hypothetical protein